jgi:23S rRNA pseudouridine955/2504/2580 synthase
MKKDFSINSDSVNSRLDRWIKRNVGDVPQSLIERNIRKGNIKVNSKKEKSSYKLQIKDLVNLKNIKFAPSKHKEKTKKYIATKKDLIHTSSIFIENNDDFVVLNKPAGIPVQFGTKSRKNILDIMRSSKEFNNATPFTVHRIDKETTGVLIIAKNRKYAQLFTSLFRIRKIYKTYLGIVLGEFNKTKGTLKDELIYVENNKKVKLLAITDYTVLDSNNNYSLVRLNPITGRKHQLRKQLLIHGNPILGDTKYRLTNNNPGKKNSLMLHAYKIKFSIANLKYNFTADPSLEFINTLKEKYLKIF